MEKKCLLHLKVGISVEATHFDVDNTFYPETKINLCDECYKIWRTPN